jgi:hypothetical protein
MTMPTPPVERPEGQDDPPNLQAVLRATIVLLEDLAERLRRDQASDLLLRVDAVTHVIRRLRADQ